MEKSAKQMEKKWEELERNQIQQLEEKIGDYELKFDMLIICQAACNFEHAIRSGYFLRYMYVHVYEKDKIGSLHTCKLLDYVNDPGVALPAKYAPRTAALLAKNMSHVGQLRWNKYVKRQKKRWVPLCKALDIPEVEWKDRTGKGWNSQNNIPDIMKAIAWLEDLRIPIAHPSPILLLDVEEKIEGMSHEDLLVEPDKFSTIKVFLSSMRDNLRNGRLRHWDFDLKQ